MVGALSPTPGFQGRAGGGVSPRGSQRQNTCLLLNRPGAVGRMRGETSPCLFKICGSWSRRQTALARRYSPGQHLWQVCSSMGDRHGETQGTSGILFADFISSSSEKKNREELVDTDEVIDDLIERTSGVLQDAVDALTRVREREQMDRGPAMKADDTNDNAKARHSRGVVRYRNPRLVPSAAPSSTASSRDSVGPVPEADGLDMQRISSVGLDGWFRGKVDAGPLMEKKSQSNGGRGLAFKEMEQDKPESFVFSAPMAPEESIKGSRDVFPEHLAIRFHSDVFSNSSSKGDGEEEESVTANKAQEKVEEKAVQSRTTSGEEFGENGYWYRWTEVSGENETGSVVWTERWWEISDWSGMKELGAEKYGINDSGDAWRETWTEKITIDGNTRKPMVSRNAHKWARASNNQEWEEKWSEIYWSGGKTEKWADKWGRDGDDVWHETWGENYDGSGGCVKWTDRWAESPDLADSQILNKWGDKWREEFKDGCGEKTGETWQETINQHVPGDAHKYQRWWGEKHTGDGNVHKYGNSTTGEHWDVTEHMETYYNPIPHFGYDLALSHSPQLHNVPVLPRDDILDLDFE